jgi:hypothetical protein
LKVSRLAHCVRPVSKLWKYSDLMFAWCIFEFELQLINTLSFGILIKLRMENCSFQNISNFMYVFWPHFCSLVKSVTFRGFALETAWMADVLHEIRTLWKSFSRVLLNFKIHLIWIFRPNHKTAKCTKQFNTVSPKIA